MSKKTKERKIIVDGKEAIRFVIDACEESIGNRKCQFCKESIWDDNFGGIVNKKFICNNTICLIKFIDPK